MIAPLERRPLGRTALTISRLGVGGGSSFGRAGDAGVDLLDACWDAGLRYFDTAPLYGEGESERRYGRALRSRPRDEFVLSTKVGRNSASEFDYSAEGVRQSLARSLERLGLSRIDAVMIHDVDPDLHGDRFERHLDAALSGAYTALNDLRDQGVIGAAGNHRTHTPAGERLRAPCDSAGRGGTAVSAVASGGGQCCRRARKGG